MYDLIEVNNLLFDENNPRLEDITNQDDALKKIIADQGRKLLNLAQDIVAMKSTNPSELPIVIPSPDKRGKYIVLEGNRRLAVLTLLWNKSLISDLEDTSLRNEFQKFYTEFHKNPISNMQCYIAKSNEEADHWRKLRHTGANDGVGTVRWEPAAISRFSKLLGISNANRMAMQIVEHLKQDPSLNTETKERLDEVKITNLARLVNDPDVRKIVGIKVTDGKIDTNTLTNETVKNLGTVIDAITEEKFKVKKIYQKQDRREFLDALGVTPAPIDGGQSGKNGISGNGQQLQGASKERPKKSLPLSTQRKALIPPSTIIKIPHPRLNKIYRELRTLEVDDYENCVAVMLRVFIELSIDEFSKRNSVPKYSEKSELNNKIKTVITYMEKNDLLEEKKLKGIRIEVNNPHSLLSTNTLNAYVHNPDVEPKSTELKTTWNRIEIFVVKLWE
jgi:hypothetical protein